MNYASANYFPSSCPAGFLCCTIFQLSFQLVLSAAYQIKVKKKKPKNFHIQIFWPLSDHLCVHNLCL